MHVLRAPGPSLVCALITGCGVGLADPAPYLDVPTSLDAEAPPGVPTAIAVPVRNSGTATAYITVAGRGDVEVPGERLQLPADDATELLVLLTTDGYASAHGDVTLTVRDQVWTVALTLDADPDVDDDGFDALAAGGFDCDDDDPLRRPDATELCNGLDDDCDDTIDEDLPLVVYFLDDDDDGHGDAATPSEPACAAPDGFVASDDDCDDADPDIHPGAVETWYDGVDQDCAEDSDDDQDHDGHDASAQGGDDCDDLSAATFPGATELDDGLDNDCDSFRDEDIIAAGDLVFTEVFVDPVTGTPGLAEWVEIHNVSSTHADLAQVELAVDGDSVFLAEVASMLPPNGVFLACADDDPAANGGVDCDGALPVPTGARSFVLTGPDGLVDEVDAAGWAFTAGRSLELAADAVDADDNDLESSWCVAVSLFGDAAGDRGTPGALLPPCP